jgi:hypothetical protein
MLYQLGEPIASMSIFPYINQVWLRSDIVLFCVTCFWHYLQVNQRPWHHWRWRCGCRVLCRNNCRCRHYDPWELFPLIQLTGFPVLCCAGTDSAEVESIVRSHWTQASPINGSIRCLCVDTMFRPLDKLLTYLL